MTPLAFLHAPAGVAPLEVRCAHPVRLPPATHSQGHGRPCLQSRPPPGLLRHLVFQDTCLHVLDF